MFKEQMIDALFGVWADNPYIHRPDTIIDSAIDTLAKKFQAADHENKIFIESLLMQVICACEEKAFKDGLSMCIGLFNGSIFTERATE